MGSEGRYEEEQEKEVEVGRGGRSGRTGLMLVDM